MAKLIVEGVECFYQPDIQGEKLPEYPYGFPFNGKLLNGLVELCPVLVDITDPEEEPSRNVSGRQEGQTFGLRSLSGLHGRSFEILVGEPKKSEHALAVWQDEYGNFFTTLSTKGNNFSDPRVYRSNTAPSGYIPHGLQETDAYLRVVRASRILRQNKVDTEMVVRTIEPKYFRYYKLDENGKSVNGEFEYVTLDEFKRRLLMDHWELIGGGENSLEEFQRVSQAIGEMSFFITIRAMQIGNRIADLLTDQKHMRLEIEKIFHVLNLYRSKELGETLSIENPEHILWYFENFLPTMIGQNMGAMHRAGLVHTFPVIGNVTALGGLVDLDSVRGEPLGLGDKTLTEEDYLNDFNHYTLDADLDDFADLKNILAFGLILAGQKDENFKPGQSHVNFQANFTAGYVRLRFDAEDPNLEPEEVIANIKKMLPFALNRVGLKTLYNHFFEENLNEAKLPEVLAQEEFEQISGSLVNWMLENHREIMLKSAMRQIGPLPVSSVVLGHGALESFEMVSRALHSLNKELWDIKERLLKPLLETTRVKEILTNWIEANKKPDSKWQTNQLLELALLAVAEEESEKLWAKVRESEKPVQDTKMAIKTHVESIINYQHNQHNNKVTAFFINGKLSLLSNNLPINDWLKAIKYEKPVLSSSGIKEAEIKPLRLPKDGIIKLKCQARSNIQEIFIGGESEAVKIVESDDKLSGAADVYLKLKPGSEYIAWTTDDLNAKAVKLHIRLIDKADKEMLVETLRSKGFVFNTFEKVQKEMGKKVLPALMNMLESQKP